MHKAFVIARREYLAMVVSKAFLFSLAIMPVFMLGGAVIPQLLRNRVDLKDKQIVVLDQSDQVLASIQEAVKTRNQQATRNAESGKQIAPEYRIEAAPSEPVTDELRLRLSDRVRNGELYAFVEIPADVLDSPQDDKNCASSSTKRSE